MRSTSPVTSTEPSSRNDGCRVLDDLEARALECGAAGRGELGRLEAGDSDSPTPPELGVDEDGKVPSSELVRDSLHSGDVVPVAVAEHDRLDVTRQDLEPAHVLDDTGRRHAGVEEDRSLAAAGCYAHERREAGLRDQGIGQAVVGNRRGDSGPREMMKPGRALDVLCREQQRVGHVVHQNRDPDAVNRLSGMGVVLMSPSFACDRLGGRPPAPSRWLPLEGWRYLCLGSGVSFDVHLRDPVQPRR